jgi:hypothetical protein
MWNALIGRFGNIATGLDRRALAWNDDLVVGGLTDNSPCGGCRGRACLACRGTGYTCCRGAGRANCLRHTEEIARVCQCLVEGRGSRSIDSGRLGEQSRVHVQDEYLIGTRRPACAALVPDIRQGTPWNRNLS